MSAEDWTDALEECPSCLRMVPSGFKATCPECDRRVCMDCMSGQYDERPCFNCLKKNGQEPCIAG
jgi:hypothetical protein